MKKKNKINEFKEIMHEGMIENFEKYGNLAPVLFFYMNGQPMIGLIPKDFLENSETKEKLGLFIKNMCIQPNVLVAGIITEAYSAKVIPNTEMSKLVLNGDIRVSEMKEKVDVIIMIFSTPEKEEMFCYTVDNKNKKVLENFIEDAGSGNLGGIFSHFFDWKNN